MNQKHVGSIYLKIHWGLNIKGKTPWGKVCIVRPNPKHLGNSYRGSQDPKSCWLPPPLGKPYIHKIGDKLAFWVTALCFPGVWWEGLLPWAQIPGLSEPELVDFASSPSWAESLSYEPCSGRLHQVLRNEGLLGRRGAAWRAGTPAKVLVLPPNLLGSTPLKTSIQLPLMLKLCDSLKCT